MINTFNKLFKRDSQRVAFLLCVGFSDLGGMRRHRYCVAHPLTGRYVQGGSVIKVVATWFHLNQKAITIFAVFLVIGLL